MTDTLDKDLRRSREYLERAFPLGSTVRFRHGRYLRRGTVIGHSEFSLSLRIQGSTGATYWKPASAMVAKQEHVAGADA